MQDSLDLQKLRMKPKSFMGRKEWMVVCQQLCLEASPEGRANSWVRGCDPTYGSSC